MKRHGKRGRPSLRLRLLARWVCVIADVRRWLNGTRVVLRPDGDGNFDEILVYDRFGTCIVHLETLDDHLVWMGLYTRRSATHVDIVAKDGRLAYIVNKKARC